MKVLYFIWRIVGYSLFLPTFLADFVTFRVFNLLNRLDLGLGWIANKWFF